MYRESNECLLETIERLERELDEIRALRATPRPRERAVLVVAAVASMVAAVAIAAFASVSARADDADLRFQKARAVVEEKTRTLGECETLADRESSVVRAYRMGDKAN
jgi:hypothetical protein